MNPRTWKHTERVRWSCWIMIYTSTLHLGAAVSVDRSCWIYPSVRLQLKITFHAQQCILARFVRIIYSFRCRYYYCRAAPVVSGGGGCSSALCFVSVRKTFGKFNSRSFERLQIVRANEEQSEKVDKGAFPTTASSRQKIKLEKRADGTDWILAPAMATGCRTNCLASCETSRSAGHNAIDWTMNFAFDMIDWNGARYAVCGASFRTDFSILRDHGCHRSQVQRKDDRWMNECALEADDDTQRASSFQTFSNSRCDDHRKIVI